MAASVDEHNECTNKYEFSTMESVKPFTWSIYREALLIWSVEKCWWLIPSPHGEVPAQYAHPPAAIKPDILQMSVGEATSSLSDSPELWWLALRNVGLPTTRVALVHHLSFKACLPLDLRQYFKEWQIPQGRNSLSGKITISGPSKEGTTEVLPVGICIYMVITSWLLELLYSVKSPWSWNPWVTHLCTPDSKTGPGSRGGTH